MAEKNIGKVVQVIGPVIDVEFGAEHLPELYTALRVDAPAPPGGERVHLVAEVQQHIGRNQVRAVAMSSTDGLVRGMEAVDTGGPISVPVGKYALGRILNVLASRWTGASRSRPTRSGGRSTAIRRNSKSRIPTWKCSRRGSRWWKIGRASCRERVCYVV